MTIKETLKYNNKEYVNYTEDGDITIMSLIEDFEYTETIFELFGVEDYNNIDENETNYEVITEYI
jgi:hypothetical protein